MINPFADIDAKAWPIEAFLLRLFAATLLVPVFEELLIRGYIFRTSYQYSELRKKGDPKAFENTLDKECLNFFNPGAWNWFAVVFSSVSFTLGHSTKEWLAAFVYSLLISVVWIHRKDLVSCIAAHATTNFVLGLYVLMGNNWRYW